MLELVRQRARYMIENEMSADTKCGIAKVAAVLAAIALVLQVAEMFYHAVLE